MLILSESVEISLMFVIETLEEVAESMDNIRKAASEISTEQREELVNT